MTRTRVKKPQEEEILKIIEDFKNTSQLDLLIGKKFVAETADKKEVRPQIWAGIIKGISIRDNLAPGKTYIIFTSVGNFTFGYDDPFKCTTPEGQSAKCIFEIIE